MDDEDCNNQRIIDPLNSCNRNIRENLTLHRRTIYNKNIVWELLIIDFNWKEFAIITKLQRFFGGCS